MKKVFADTCYWVAVVYPGDQHAQAAKDARKKAGKALVVTTDEVLCELLNYFCEGGSQFRKLASDMARMILGNPNVRVLPQTRDTFLRGLAFYESRPDKEFSLVDCISMLAMRDEGIQEVLTYDDHFAQESFTVLMKQE